ncbi:Brr6-like protein [Spraguea lophii 42_110]|uniref:Brr6-like protein n=1 Tax=Spraguea lophii (strain 42_110) TaxID=1358809 RepID=S7WAV5_SPRLO|nr:Brr6-like protein [Spraguea lophii 42_110]
MPGSFIHSFLFQIIFIFLIYFMPMIPTDNNYTFNWECEERETKRPCKYISDEIRYSIVPINKNSYSGENKQINSLEKQECNKISTRDNENNHNIVKSIPMYIIPFLHIIFNILVLFVLSYALISFASYFRNDLRIRIDEEIEKNSYIISEATRNYRENNCINCVPALKEPCYKWKVEMSMDKNKVKVLPILSSIAAEVISTVVDNISYKGFILGVGLMVVYLKYSKNNLK